MSLAVWAATAQAQEIGHFVGGTPSPGIAVAVYTGGPAEEMLLAAPNATSFWVTVDGRFIGYLAGSPTFVNQSFLDQFPEGIPRNTPLIVLTPEGLAGPPPTATPTQASSCEPWPAPVAAMLEVLPVPDGLCFKRFEGLAGEPPGFYGNNTVNVTDGHAMELRDLSYRICTAAQYDAVLDAGFPISSLYPNWMATPEGRDYVERTPWAQDGNGWWVHPTKRYSSPIIDAHQACSYWFDPGSIWSAGALQDEFTPGQREWAAAWLPNPSEAGGTTSPADCDEWPEELGPMIRALNLDDLCLERVADADDVPPDIGDMLRNLITYYHPSLRTVFRLSFESTSLIEITAHEVCHAHQQWAAEDAGFSGTSSWYDTAEGRNFIEVTGESGPFALENAAQICAFWYNPGGVWDWPPEQWDYNMPPAKRAWAERWLPRDPVPELVERATDGFDYPIGESFRPTHARGDAGGWNVPNGFGDVNDPPVCSALFHPGDDWNRDDGADAGEPVRAVANGSVVATTALTNGAGSELGHGVAVEHELPNGSTIYSVYVHVDIEPGIAVGSPVERGQTIASIAPLTAFSPHLHFELRTRFDPSDWYPGDDTCGYYATLEAIAANGFIDPVGFIDTHRS